MAAAAAGGGGGNQPPANENLSTPVNYNRIEYRYTRVSCIPYTHTDGKEYFVRIRVPEEATSENVRKTLLGFHTIYTQETFPTAPDGIYTWLLGDKGFYALRVLSRFEFGTLHSNIADYTQTTKVYVAGECYKQGSAVEFNIMSGTYSYEIVKSARKMNNTTNTATPRLTAKAQKLFEGMGLTASINEDKTLITNVRTPLTKEELVMYKAAGFVVELFTDEKVCSPFFFLQMINEMRLINRQITSVKGDPEKYAKLMAAGKEKTAGYFKPNPEKVAELQAKRDAIQGDMDRIKRETITLFGGRRARQTRKRKSKRSHKKTQRRR